MSPAGESSAPEGGWASLKVAELQDELDARGLPKAGKKAELVARLEEHEAASGEAAQPVASAEAAQPAEGVEPTEPAESAEAAEPVEPAGSAEPELSSPGRRRGSPETGAERARRRAPARGDGEALVVSARARYVRSAPRKARLVMGHIRGKPVEQAQAILGHAPRAVSTDILKLLNSAVANAESAHELGPDELRVLRAFVDEGPIIKRWRPRARGRATRINKRTSHMTIQLTTTEGTGR